MYSIYTRCLSDKNPTWDGMLSGFATSHEALTWLISTYEFNAIFWQDLEVKIVAE